MDRARSIDKQWSQYRRLALPGETAGGAGGTGRGPRFKARTAPRDRVVVVTSSTRRRSRQAVPRPRVVQFSLTEEEFGEVSLAAQRSGLARGAFAAEAALASARGAQAR